MALREVKPLNAEQWKLVVSTLKTGPTDKQRKLVAESLQRAKELQEI